MASHGIALHSEGFLGCPGQELELFDDMLYLGSKTREGMARKEGDVDVGHRTSQCLYIYK